MDVQDHLSGGVVNVCIRASGGVVEQPKGFIACFVGALDFCCSIGTKGDKHGDVDSDHIVEESPNNLLYKVEGLW